MQARLRSFLRMWPMHSPRGVVARAAGAPGTPISAGLHPVVRILTYNLWFAEHIALEERMKGLVDIIQDNQPDVLLFQEVTPLILKLLLTEHTNVFKEYTLSAPPRSGYFTILGYHTQKMTALQGVQRVSFDSSYMDRDVLSVPLSLSNHPTAPPLLVATSHLESPLGDARPNIEERVMQLRTGSELLEENAEVVASSLKTGAAAGQPVDIVWGGDMNWISSQADPQLLPHWQDVWATQHPNNPGMTWDPKTNAMICDEPFPPSRLDRFFARLENWQVQGIKVVGTQPLPGVLTLVRGELMPRKVLVSDHYGLLLTLHYPQQAA